MENQETIPIPDVAGTILKQIGGKGALAMMGTKAALRTDCSLEFDLKGCRKINKIRITLLPTDLYLVEMFRINHRKLTFRGVARYEGVYAEDLKRIIEEDTGLYLSL